MGSNLGNISVVFPVLPMITSRVAVRLAVALVSLSLLADAQLAAQSTYRVAPSGRATSVITFTAVVPRGTPPAQRPAPLTVSVNYGQPHARGRDVAGGLIPYGAVWRLGANEATALSTELDLDIGGQRVPKGQYTLFALATETSMQLIVNKKTGQWGTEYDATMDLVRIPMTLQRRTDALTGLQITLEPGGADAPLSGVLRVQWGTVDAMVPFSAAP